MSDLRTCPFTHVEKDLGHFAWVHEDLNRLWFVGCNCGYRGPIMATREQAIQAHLELMDIRSARTSNTPNVNPDKVQEVERLQKRIDELEWEVLRYANRDGKASIRLCAPTGNNPWHQEELQIVDFGVSDNIYVVEALTPKEKEDA